jgi:PAS domain-containing protein
MLAWSELAIVLGAAILTSALALGFLNNRARPVQRLDGPPPDPIALLFEGTTLTQATPPAMTLLGLEPGMHEWADLSDALSDQFSDFPIQVYHGQSGNLVLSGQSGSGPTQAQIKWQDNRCWVTLSAQTGSELSQAETDELDALRRVSDTTTSPAWQTDKNGNVVWRNTAYDTLIAAMPNNTANDVLFDLSDADLPKRFEVKTPTSDTADWYEVDILQRDGFSIYTATCITSSMQAEAARRNFVQTLTKTFAHLHTGLAIFDRKGQLALFNPALVDLTGLSAQFLSARPTILSFFDALRENRRMPEPKNYLSWRQEIADLIAAASGGRYCESWSLETGQTYNVQGRPHPDGATAFIIEDVSAEVTLTRNFRAELELSHSLLDTMHEGLAVFSPTGLLTFCNQTYKDMWNVDPDSSFIDVTIADSVTAWRQQSAQNSRWAEIETSVLTYGHREGWSMSVVQKSGNPLSCEIVPIAAAATLVRFRAQAPVLSEERPQLSAPIQG